MVKNRIIKKIIIILLVSFCVEIFVFNIRFFQSALYDRVLLSESNTIAIENAHLLSDGCIELDDGYSDFTVTIGNLDKRIQNIHLDIEIVDEDNTTESINNVCNVSVMVWDDALHEKKGEDGNTYLDSGLYDLTSKEIISLVPESEYIWIETFGNVKEIKLTISAASGVGRVFRINELSFNATQELHVSFVRLAVIYIFLLICDVILLEKGVWKADCVTPAKWKLIVPMVLYLLVAVAAFMWTMANPAVFGPDQNEYAPLARALLRGETFVGTAGEFVKAAEGKIVFWSTYSPEVKFDYAYYDGRFYVYFGVLPCIVFFLPYLIATGRDLPNFIPVVMLCLALLAEVYIFLGMLIRRYYRNTPFVARLLMTAAAGGGTYLVSLISVPNHYTVAIAFGVFLSLAGVMFWMRAFTETMLSGGMNEKKYTVRTGYLAGGSVCMAAVSLCRPTLLILGVSILLVIMARDRKVIAGMDRKNMRSCVLAVTIPYTALALMCLYYNYARFGSPFDFGASKNMTTIPFNGGTGFLPYLIIRAIYEYLFAPAILETTYPFFTYQSWEQITDGGSILVSSKPDIGLFTGTPVLWLGLLCIGFWKSLKKKGLLEVLMAMFVCAFILMAFATRFTFCLTERYTLEFSFIFFLFAFIGIMEFHENTRAITNTRLISGVFWGIRLLLLASALYGGLQLMPEKWMTDLSSYNTELYYRIFYAMNFML